MTFSLAKLGRSQWRLYLFTKTVPFLSSESGCRRFSTVVSDGYGTTVISCSLLTRTINQYCLMSLFCCDQSSKLRFPLFLLIMSENIHKKLQDISLGIDDEIVNLPLDLCEEAAEENRFSLITRPINPRRQNLRAMMLAFPRLWGFSDEVTGRLLQNQQVQFIFTSEEAMLSRDPSTILNSADGDPYLTSYGAIHGNIFHCRGVFKCGLSTLSFRYEKLRGFCTACGMMNHNASECPSNMIGPQIAPQDDDDDDNGGDDHPPGFPDIANNDERNQTHEEPDVTESDNKSKRTPNKKRKTEEHGPVQDTHTAYCDVRHWYVNEEMEEHLSKRKRVQAEFRDARAWYPLPNDHESGSSRGHTSNGHQHQHSDGQIRRRQREKWNPPPRGWVKCNYDVSHHQAHASNIGKWPRHQRPCFRLLSSSCPPKPELQNMRERKIEASKESSTSNILKVSPSFDSQIAPSLSNS
ncbi:hypothetical protein Bca101_065495 [Brassica carinata]